MTEIEMNEGASRGLDRRTIIKGAAWSVPVVAAAVATPLAAATTPNWNASLSAGCLLGIAGNADLIPSFQVSETLGNGATEAQHITETYSQDFQGLWLATRTLAVTQAGLIATAVVAEWALFRVSAILQGQNSSKIDRDVWPIFSADDFDVVYEERQVPNPIPFLPDITEYRPTVQLRASRQVTVTGLSANESVAWGYLASVLVGLRIDVPGVGTIGGAPRIVATMTSGTGANTGDESAQIGAGSAIIEC